MAMQDAGQWGAATLRRYGRRAASMRRPVARRARAAAGAVSDFDARTLATGLGGFGIGLGLAELLAPGSLARLIGATDDETTRRALQACGVREIAAGVGILTQPRSAGWMWSRVAGDVMDLSLLGAAFTSRSAQKDRLAAATAAVVGVTMLDIVC